MPLPLYEWNGIKPGEPVKVQGERGSFVFRHVLMDAEGVVTSVCVLGGAANRTAFRHFTPERVSEKSLRKTT